MAARAAGILVLTNMLPKGDETQCLYVAVNFGDEDEVGAKTEANNALAWLLKTSKTIQRHLNVTSDTPLNLQLKITNIRFSKCGKRTYKNTAGRH